MAKQIIKGFIGTIVGVTLGGEAIRQAGSLPTFAKPTQTLIGLGVVKVAAKSIFNFK